MMATEVSCLRQPLPSINAIDEGATACSSSSEEEYHVNLNGHHSARPFTSLKSKVDKTKAIQIDPVSGSKRPRNQKSPVSATDLLRAAKMAQAAGVGKIQSMKLARYSMEPPLKRKLTNDKKPFIANRVRALAVKNSSNVSEPIYTATSANTDLSNSNQSADFVKLEKALRTVDTMAVVGRLCRVDGIMPDLALHVVYEYLRFLILLIRCQDWNATMLWPSPMVDFAWRQHVLDTVKYLSDCQSICGRFIHYNPDAELGGQQLCAIKYSRTLALYKSVFGDPPIGIWPTEQDLIPDNSLPHPNSEVSTCIQLICRIPTGTTTTIEVNLGDSAGQIFDKLKNWENVSLDSHILVLNGDILNPNKLMNSLELKQGMFIDVIPAINAR